MWIDVTLKVPLIDEWLAVVRVTEDGEAKTVAYLTAVPEDFDQDLRAVQQRWQLRDTWPGDEEIQEGARIREFHKYPEDVADG